MAQARCERCGRDITLSATGETVCSSCGWTMRTPVGAATDDSQTRPVPPAAVAAALGRAPTQPPPEEPTIPPVPPQDALTSQGAPYGSYAPPPLPRSGVQAGAGAAPEITAYLPPGIAGGAARLDQTADLPPSLAPGAKEAEAARRRRTGLSAISAVALLVVLLLGATGIVLFANGGLSGLFGKATATATASPTVTPTVTPAATFTRFSATDGSFSLNVPSSWTTSHAPTENLYLITDPVTNSDFEIETLASPDDPKSLDDQVVSSLKASPPPAGQGTATAGTVTSDTTTVFGRLWVRETVDLAVSNGGQTTTWHVVSLSARNGQRTMLIFYFARASVFAAEDSAYFQPMLASLTLPPAP